MTSGHFQLALYKSTNALGAMVTTIYVVWWWIVTCSEILLEWVHVSSEVGYINPMKDVTASYFVINDLLLFRSILSACLELKYLHIVVTVKTFDAYQV